MNASVSAQGNEEKKLFKNMTLETNHRAIRAAEDEALAFLRLQHDSLRQEMLLLTLLVNPLIHLSLDVAVLYTAQKSLQAQQTLLPGRLSQP